MAQEFQSLKGQLLLDSGQLRGSFFHRSVVLICHHDLDGAFGLILNQQTPNKLGDALVADVPESLQEEALFIGGPVQPGSLTYLHSDRFLPEANVMTNLSMGHSIEDLQEIGSSFSPDRQIRCFAGYAGWTGGQLESEMERKAWLMHPATLELVFSDTPRNLWQSILKEKGWKLRLLADAPDDLASN